MERTRRRRLSTALALLLALESVAAVTAVGSTVLATPPVAHALPAEAPAGAVLAETGASGRDREPSTAPAPANAPDPRDYQRPRVPAPASIRATASAQARTSSAAKASPGDTAAKASAPRKSEATTSTAPAAEPPSTAAAAASYTGRNHMWIPSLGMDRSVSFFACDRAAAPDNVVYRWGCAGSNNVYLLGHAWGVFKPLHDSYLSGTLQVGMRVYYADGSGTTHVYAVQWWKLTRPTTAASWAWAAQDAPSMTLQTCMGANSEYRLMVRLAQVG